MASESETLADIVAEIRAYGAQPPPRLMWLEIADRILAAWEREREELREAATEKMLEGATIIDNRGQGNAAAIYSALVKIHDLTNALDEKCGVDPVEIRDIARAALSAPARNCDRPECATSKAEQDVWRKEDGGKTPYYEWLLAPAAELEGERR